MSLNFSNSNIQNIKKLSIGSISDNYHIYIDIYIAHCLDF